MAIIKKYNYYNTGSYWEVHNDCDKKTVHLVVRQM